MAMPGSRASRLGAVATITESPTAVTCSPVAARRDAAGAVPARARDEPVCDVGCSDLRLCEVMVGIAESRFSAREGSEVGPFDPGDPGVLVVGSVRSESAATPPQAELSAPSINATAHPRNLLLRTGG